MLLNFNMNKIHNLAWIVLRHFPLVGLFLGIFAGFAVHYFGESDFLFSHRNIFLLSAFIVWILGNYVAQFFYSPDVYQRNMKDHVSYRAGWALTPLIPLFYSTMTSNISIFRKICGYIHIMAQINVVATMMTMMFSVFFDRILR